MEVRLKRIRLVFEDSGVLCKSQRARGLQHSWIMLPPDVATVSDLARHVAAAFKFRRSLVGDLLFSIEGFVLPPFESTVIIEDKDIVSVRMKGLNPENVTSMQKNGNDVEDHKLLTAAETKEQSEGNEKERNKESYNHPDDSIYEKKKRQKLPGVEKRDKSNGNAKAKGSDLEQDAQCAPETDHSGRELQKEKNSYFENDGMTRMNSSALEDIDKNIDFPAPSKDRHSQQPERCKSPLCEMFDTGATRKTNSRSARRKKARKIYHRSLANSCQVELQMSSQIGNGLACQESKTMKHVEPRRPNEPTQVRPRKCIFPSQSKGSLANEVAAGRCYNR